jgi:hypothetical protein
MTPHAAIRVVERELDPGKRTGDADEQREALNVLWELVLGVNPRL